MLAALFSSRPARKRRALHSRRWDVNIEKVRRAHAKLPAEVRDGLLEPGLLEQLATDGSLHAALAAEGLPPAEVERLVTRLRPPLVGAVLGFLREALASDERGPLVLPRELVYHEVVLPLPPALDPRAQVEPDGAGLLAVAKATKLLRGKAPREARDARRANRVLRHCDACGAYKQSVEFYACCLHDEQRVCRACMLGRPSEPFGEHLTEEYRTGPVRRSIHLCIHPSIPPPIYLSISVCSVYLYIHVYRYIASRNHPFCLRFRCSRWRAPHSAQSRSTSLRSSER